MNLCARSPMPERERDAVVEMGAEGKVSSWEVLQWTGMALIDGQGERESDEKKEWILRDLYFHKCITAVSWLFTRR